MSSKSVILSNSNIIARRNFFQEYLNCLESGSKTLQFMESNILAVRKESGFQSIKRPQKMLEFWNGP